MLGRLGMRARTGVDEEWPHQQDVARLTEDLSRRELCNSQLLSCSMRTGQNFESTVELGHRV